MSAISFPIAVDALSVPIVFTLVLFPNFALVSPSISTIVVPSNPDDILCAIPPATILSVVS